MKRTITNNKNNKTNQPNKQTKLIPVIIEYFTIESITFNINKGFYSNQYVTYLPNMKITQSVKLTKIAKKLSKYILRN